MLKKVQNKQQTHTRNSVWLADSVLIIFYSLLLLVFPQPSSVLPVATYKPPTPLNPHSHPQYLSRAWVVRRDRKLDGN